MTTTAAITIEGVSRSFGSKLALDDVDVTVLPGEIHALLGPNGAGKTTLIRVIVGSVKPTKGSVTVMGVPWSDLSKPSSRTLFGLVAASDRSAYHRLSGLENLMFFGRLYGLSKREARRRAFEVLAQVGLEDAANVRTGVYSHGMQKRLTMARAMLMEPPVLLVDEATHDLDPAGARRVREMLRHAADQGAAILWATQRVDEIRDTADSVTVLDRGRVKFTGTVDLLARSFDRHRYRLELAAPVDPDSFSDSSLASRLEPLAHSDGYLLTLPDGFSLGQAIIALSQDDLDVTACRLERSDVEDAFLELTTEAER